MIRRAASFAFIAAVALAAPANLAAQGGMPPSKVVLAEAREGEVAPLASHVGTVYFHEVSDVASEVSGLVEAVHFDEGDRVEVGRPLLQLNTDMLRKRLQSSRALYEQVLVDLERAGRDLARVETLQQEDAVAEQVYDGHVFGVKGLEKRAAALQAELERLEIELAKTAVRAPFSGVVVEKHVARGEWLSPGSVVAVLAMDDLLDVVVEVPQESVPFIATGLKVEVTVGARTLEGTVTAVIPRGDIKTRTFPVKIRARNTHGLIEGMEATASLPAGARETVLFVPRDGVITQFGMQVVFTALESDEGVTVKMVPVSLVGYDGMNAGIRGEGLVAGVKVVVNGNERLRDGQPVIVVPGR